MAKRVLIAGCGYVGAAAADLFVEAGWTAEGWTRHGGTSGRGGLVLREVDLTSSSQVEQTSEEFDVVIHAASTRGGDADSYRRVYFEGAQNLLQRFTNARLLFVSSTSVYAQRDGSWVTEESPVEPAHESGRILRDVGSPGTELEFAL